MPQTIPPQSVLHDLFEVFGRVIIGSYFIAQSSGVILASGTLPELAAAGALPAMLFWGSFGFQFVAALALILGFQAAIAAAALAVHVLWTSSLYNFEPGNGAALELFWKDVAMVGGLLMVMSVRRCAYSIDRGTGDDHLPAAGQAVRG